MARVNIDTIIHMNPYIFFLLLVVCAADSYINTPILYGTWFGFGSNTTGSINYAGLAKDPSYVIFATICMDNPLYIADPTKNIILFTENTPDWIPANSNYMGFAISKYINDGMRYYRGLYMIIFAGGSGPRTYLTIDTDKEPMICATDQLVLPLGCLTYTML
jgi:hypothetical protein